MCTASAQKVIAPLIEQTAISQKDQAQARAQGVPLGDVYRTNHGPVDLSGFVWLADAMGNITNYNRGGEVGRWVKKGPEIKNQTAIEKADQRDRDVRRGVSDHETGAARAAGLEDPNKIGFTDSGKLRDLPVVGDLLNEAGRRIGMGDRRQEGTEFNIALRHREDVGVAPVAGGVGGGGGQPNMLKKALMKLTKAGKDAAADNYAKQLASEAAAPPVAELPTITPQLEKALATGAVIETDKDRVTAIVEKRIGTGIGGIPRINAGAGKDTERDRDSAIVEKRIGKGLGGIPRINAGAARTTPLKETPKSVIRDLPASDPHRDRDRDRDEKAPRQQKELSHSGYQR